jgi:hypothetical protein
MLRRPLESLLILIVYLPLESFFVSAIPIKFQNVVGLFPEGILIMIFTVFLIKKEGRFKFYAIDFILIVLLLWGLIVTIINKVDLFYVVNGFRVLFRYSLVFYAVRFVSEPLELFKRVITILKGLAVFEVVFGLLQIIGKQVSPSYWNNLGNNIGLRDSLLSIQGTLPRYDQYGMFLSFVSIIIFSTYITSPKKQNNNLFVLFLISIGIIISTSRQAMLMFLIGNLIILYLNRRSFSFSKKSFLLLLLTINVFTLAVIAYLLASPSLEMNGRNPLVLITSLADPNTYEIDKQLNFRLYYLFVIGPQLIKDHFIGLGFGTFGETFSVQYMNWVYDKFGLDDPFFIRFIADVNWVTILGQLGLIGVSLFAGYLISIIAVARKYLKIVTDEYGMALLGSCMAITTCSIIAGFLGPNFEIRTNSIFLWLISGLAISFVQGGILSDAEDRQ